MGELMNYHNANDESDSFLNPPPPPPQRCCHCQCCSQQCSSQSAATFAADVFEERIKRLVLDPEDEETDDTFAQRAESYFHRRPQLVSLIQDLYKAYRCSLLVLASTNNNNNNHHKQQKHSFLSSSSKDQGGAYSSSCSSSSCSSSFNIRSHITQQQQQLLQYYPSEDDDNDDDDTDAQSTISHLPTSQSQANTMMDPVIVELVMKTVEFEIVTHELPLTITASSKEIHFNETSSLSSWSSSWSSSISSSSSSRKKIELQKSLLEVLESERVILVNEKARLEYNMSALLRLNQVLTSEAMFIKHKAKVELTHYMLKLRDQDHMVRVLSHKIQHLESQIFDLQNNNFDRQLIKNKTSVICSKCDANHHHQVPAAAASGGTHRRKIISKRRWWDNNNNNNYLRKFNFLLCRPYSS